MLSSRFNVPGFARVTVIHHSDWSGCVTIFTWKEGQNPEDSIGEKIEIPHGILQAIFRSVVAEFLRVTMEEMAEKFLNLAGRRNPWG